MKKVVILGPINSRGGREIEAAFIADVLSEKYEVTIYSTETIELKNDLFLVNPSLNVYKKNKPFFNKIKAFIGVKINYESLRFKSLKTQKIKSLENAIIEADLIVVVAQLTSNYSKKIIQTAKKFEKKVVFRTTGTHSAINLIAKYFAYLDYVSLFINHSESNSVVFKTNKSYKYKIIDQCVFEEENILDKAKEIGAIKRFYCVSRLDNNKDVLTVIKAFNSLKSYKNLELHIIGDGYELEHLKLNVDNSNIIFYGHLDYPDMIRTISNFHCLIIASLEETGPYNALEAMVLGIPVISTKVGAMKERFVEENNMWFNQGDWESLAVKVVEYSNFKLDEIKLIQKRYIEIYKNNHSKKSIAKAYLDAVSLYL